MLRPPLISIIMPAYNCERTIGAAIDSALTQTHPRVEVIVADDGSTDRTRDICRAHGDLISFVPKENGGTASARNAAMRVARGDFFALVDADDLLLPPFLEVALERYRDAGGGRRIVTNDAHILTSTGISHGRRVMYAPVPPVGRQRLRLLQRNYVSILSVFPRSLFEEIGPFDESLRYREDWDYWLRAAFAGWEVVAQPRPHALYRWSPGAKTLSTAGYEAETALLRSLYEREGPFLTTAERNYLARRITAPSPRLLESRGEGALRNGDYATARRAFNEASWLDPSNRRLQVKSRAVRVPGVGRLWRHRVSRADSALGRAD